MASQELMKLLVDVANMSHVEDWKILSSALLFATSLLGGNVIMFDVVRKNKQQIAGGRWHLPYILSSGVFYSLSIFGLARMLDGLADASFLLEHENALTTLSQNTLILEIPLLAVSAAILVFVTSYGITYIKEGRKRKEKS